MTYEITRVDLERLFPAFLEVDFGFRLRGIGPAVLRHYPFVRIGDPLESHFQRIGFPGDMALAAAAVRGTSVLLRSWAENVELSGHVISLAEGYFLALNLIPATILLEGKDLEIADFGPGDPMVRGLLLVSLQKAMLEEAQDNAVELTKERQRSLELLDRISRAAGYLAHDFNNFLSIIRLNGDRLLANGLSEPQKRLVRIILETSERGSEITRSLMTLSYQKNDSRTGVNLDRLIGDHHAFFATIAGSSIRTNLRLDAPSAIVEVPRTGMLNCLMNLIINARDAMPEGGEITISTQIRSLTLPGPAASDPQSYVAIEVADTGGGMTQEVLSRAFEQFFSTKERGSGLGLASVMEFAREMGGDACLDSPEGEGARIYIYLPVHSLADKDQLPVDPAVVASDCGRGVKILLVEDEPYALEALVEMLEDDGYQVSPTASAAQAMAILERQTHDVLLADVVMPETTGLELAAWAEKRCPGIAVVMMSGYVPEDQVMQDAWQFIRKPLDIGLLREILQAVVKKSKAQKMGQAVAGAESTFGAAP